MLPHIAARVYGTPLLIHPDKAQIIVAALHDRLGTEMPAGLDLPETSRFIGSRSRQTRPSGLSRVSNGTALITVEGTLVNRGAWLNSYSGLTSYEGIGAQVRDAANDPEVHSIVLDLDSGGGEATGMFALAAAIREARKSKRVVAVVDDVAASAAYGIASAADEIVVSPTSIVGSIGVVWLHLDRSGELAQKGVKPTLIYAGARKVDANSYGPLSPEAAADMQKLVESFYTRFLETVALGRGARTSAEKAQSTEARVFIGSDAVQAGLADRTASLEQVLAELSNPARRGPSSKGKVSMTNPTDKPEASISLEAHSTKLAQFGDERFAAGKAEGKAEGVKEGEAAAVARLDAVLSLEEAKGREAQAMALFKAGLDAEKAKGILAATPKSSSLEQRASAETTTVGAPSKPSTPSGTTGWGKAVAQANQRFGA